MPLVATINGQPVYSDKQLDEVDGSLVLFTDGSWCTVRTGAINNATDSGYIHIGGDTDPGVADTITDGPKHFPATELVVEGVQADVEVNVHAGPDITYAATGPANLVAAISVEVRDGKLVVEGDGSDGSNVTINNGVGGTIRVSGRGRVVASAGDVHISSSGTVIGGIVAGRDVYIGGRSVRSFGSDRTTVVGNDKNAVRLTLSVPEGTPVTTKGVLGEVEIGDTKGSLTATVAAHLNLRAGKVADARLKTESSGGIFISEVNGTARLRTQSSGGIYVAGGRMQHLDAKSKSSGHVRVGGTVTKAVLVAESSGNIFVDHVLRTPAATRKSSGRIRIGGVG